MYGTIRFPSGFHAVTDDDTGKPVLVNFAQIRYVRKSKAGGAELEFNDGVTLTVRETFQQVNDMLERRSGFDFRRHP